MRRHSASAALAAVLGLTTVLNVFAADSRSTIHWWASSVDGKLRLTEQPQLGWISAAKTGGVEVVEVDSTVTFQTMLGLGSSLEPSTCWNLTRLAPAERERVVERLVDPVKGIGMNLMRICIGTPDFTGDPWYSYDDLSAGETDLRLGRFSIARDRAYILPVLKLARQKNPDLLFCASPWSPPGWMKTTGDMIGGQLQRRYFPIYAEYFVKFIQAYEAEGVPIHAVTIQNEPGVDRARAKDPKWRYPSCRWTGELERDFIREHLGPTFRRHGLKTQIWCYDHNYNLRRSGDDPGLDYPRVILRERAAAAFVGGVAFHGYAGGPSGMSAFHTEFPQVPLHFTEGSVFGLEGGLELVQRLRNWASSYNAWVTMLDDNGKPNNGPFPASRTILTLNPQTLAVTENFDFFLYGQFMKFVQRGAVRIQSTEGNKLFNTVAFRNPDGGLVLIAVNAGKEPLALRLAWQGAATEARLGGESVATFRW